MAMKIWMNVAETLDANLNVLHSINQLFFLVMHINFCCIFYTMPFHRHIKQNNNIKCGGDETNQKEILLLFLSPISLQFKHNSVKPAILTCLGHVL